MNAPSRPTPALDFKSATLYALRLVLHTHEPAEIEAELTQRMDHAGSLFRQEPIVIDARQLQQSPDWPWLLELLRRQQLPVIGVLAEGTLLDDAQAAGLTAVDTAAERPARAPVAEENADRAQAAPAHAGSAQSKPAVSKKQAAANPIPAPDVAAAATGEQPATDAPLSADTLVINRPLRSGQRIYARNGDLIVIGMVSQGAEVIADGNIHVYGPLRGKAMAGARGNPGARIFTTCLEPELVAIAGVYRVVENALEPDVHQRAALIQLDGEHLRITALNT
ncbi:septum site-determining protein MinC [Alcaligenaceae bacterium SJ-26]|nr:septum site-determining protein MinC [Alcaligenaceae bacterium SJ-26]